MQNKTFFITGIDTNIGKTFVSLLLILAFRQKGLNAGYMKPVETGVKINKDGSKNYIDGHYLKEISGLEADIETVTPYTFQSPLSPYAASKFEGGTVCLKEIIYKFYDLKGTYDYMIVEGAGGMLVPLKQGHFMIDIAKYIDAAVILVTKAGLGMINHTLLNIEYAKSHGIKIAGIIINNALNETDESVLSNKKILSAYTDIPFLGDIPYLQTEKDLKDRDLLEGLALKYIDIENILG
ncbi:MAG: dethiobiotin synthase [Deltaproteobacteria bacterium]|jgi:dethiobiotin synthetase|nr:dethiobiotin synthase [Deltaproteobacteria bacterium]MCL5879730.1 dethiobiotin synthase [Deltaproteobacteria bacterium]MDA8304159.1 dethiobiotin synthase [Deltaproteobacteria bacterium]